MEYNDRQTPFDKLGLEKASEEVRLQYDDFTNNVPFINWMLGERPKAKDLPKDEYGRIIVDVTKPHILEDMDYFRPTAIHYQKTGKLCDFKPNGNPNSDYGAWVREETRRCLEGYVRPYDGEWITGDYYFFLNYCPIQLSKRGKGKKANRVVDFPFVWDGHYLITHYLYNARIGGHHAWELARRGSGKSFLGASLLAKRFILGESYEVNKRVQCVVTASERKYLTGANQILDMFQSYIDFCAIYTEWPYLRLMDSKQNLQWIMGYKDIDTGVSKGTLNSVIGISSKDDDSKLRGSRGVLYLIEECGTFARLLDTYNTIRPSVEDGDSVFGMLFGYGTSGSNDSDFRSSQEIMYNPDGYNVLSLENVYDKVGQGRSRFCYFFPGYLNRSECYDNNGNSDVSKALVEILKDRYITKYNSTDPNTITKRIAEIPITPQEAVLRVVGNLFPVSDLNARLNQLDADTSEYHDVYTGELIVDSKGEVKFSPTSDAPIRVWPTKDNKVKGAIEFYAMPEKDANGKVYKERYILGHDPADNDVAETMSLTSTFVLDLWTDRIVAEYTGRQDYADDNYEMVRKLCIFYNGRCIYEAHPYDQKVRLPNGDTINWGDIKIGDKLLSIDGNVTTVVDIPIDGVDDIYKITFDDGRVVESSSSHIWSVYKLGSNNKLSNITTKEIYDSEIINKFGQKRYFVPDNECIKYEYKDTPIDPYTLGLLIAEGSLTKFKKNKYEKFKRRIVSFSSSKEDADFYKTTIPYEMKYIGNKCYSWHIYIDDIDKKLMSLGLLFKNSYNKFIPKEYLFNSEDVRLELLKGLMDGDGCAINGSASIFVSMSKQLCDDVILLCRSLGIKAKYNNGTFGYRVAIRSEIPIFKLPRKLSKQKVYNGNLKGSKAKGFLHKTGISNIEYIGRKKCKCVTVDRPDGLYLIGDYVVTHNCNKKGIFAYFSKMNCLYLLADTPEYLKDKQLIKSIGYGNTSKGVNATQPINNFADNLIKEWLIKPVMINTEEDGGVKEVQVKNLSFIKCRALLIELISYNQFANFDRIRALGMLMLYREQYMVMWGGEVRKTYSAADDKSYLGNDDFFSKNYRQIG